MDRRSLDQVGTGDGADECALPFGIDAVFVGEALIGISGRYPEYLFIELDGHARFAGRLIKAQRAGILV